MKIYDCDYALYSQRNNYKMEMAVKEYIASTGRAIIANFPLHTGDVRIFASNNGLCDRMYFFGVTDTGAVETCVVECTQKEISATTYIGEELDCESWDFLKYMDNTYMKNKTV